MRPTHISRRLRLTIAAIVMAVAASLAVALPGAVADSPKVDVVGPSGTPQASIDLSQLDSDVSASGRTGYSLESVLDAAESEKSALEWQVAGYVEIPNSGGSQKRPTPADIGRAAAKPYLYVDDSEIVYADPKLSQEFTVSGAIRLGPETQVSLVINPSDPSPRAGEKVGFEAVTSGASGTPTFTWFVDGKARSGGKKISETFKREGRYRVEVTVEYGQGGPSASKYLDIQVGEPKESKKDREGGGKKEDGGETGESDPQQPYDPYAGGYSDPYGGGSGYPGGSGTGAGSTAPTPPASPASPPKEQPAEPVDDGLVEVSGELVSGSAPAEVIAQTPGGAPEALQEGTPSEPGGVADWVWVTLGLLGLAALGALAEARGSRLR